MEYIRHTIREFTHHFLKMPNQEAIYEVSRLDAYFNTIYKIVLWEDPILSWTILGVFHVLFWYVIVLKLLFLSNGISGLLYTSNFDYMVLFS